MGGHAHNHTRERLQGKFKLAVGLTSAILIVEIVGGILTNSLALLSDAAHVFGDVFALVLSWIAIYLSTLPPTSKRTYGYHRTEVFAAFINGVSLVGVSAWIFYEAVHRVMEPEPVDSLPMLIVAAIGMLVNLIVAMIFIKESHDNLNVKSAFLHVLSDAVASAGVIVGGVIMYYTEWYLVDPILSFAIGLAILVGGGRVTYEAFHILLEGTPKNIDIDDVAEQITELNFVEDVHDLHIWNICSDYSALSAHVWVDVQSIRAVQTALRSINNMLHEKFGIIHTTIQLESGPRDGSEPLLCDFRHVEEHEHDHDHDDDEAEEGSPGG
jgi:cobalt-zinc-cadmium efflux system protein